MASPAIRVQLDRFFDLSVPTSPIAERAESRGARNAFLDLTKAVLILLVVIGHVLQYVVYRGEGFWADPLFRIIYMFHMPLFMGLAGYLSSRSIDQTPAAALILHRFRSYVLPAILWALLFRFGATCVARQWTWQRVGSAFIDDATISFWFLWALFFSIVLTSLVRRFFPRRFVLAYALSCGAVLVVPTEELWPFVAYLLQMIKFTFPFFQMGYALAHLSKLPEGKRGSWIVAAAAAVAVVGYYLWDRETFVYNSGMRLSLDNLSNIALRYVGGIAASIVVLKLLHVVYHCFRQWLPSAIYALGRDSLAVYLLQGYFCLVIWKLKGQRGVSEPSYLGWIVALVGGLIVCLGCWCAGRALMQQPLLGRILMGRRKTPI